MYIMQQTWTRGSGKYELAFKDDTVCIYNHLSVNGVMFLINLSTFVGAIVTLMTRLTPS